MTGFQPKAKKKSAASAESAQSPAQAQALNQAPDSIPGMFKPGEFVLPPDTVHAMGGKEALSQVVQATHTPAPADAVVPRGFKPEVFFSTGGAPEDKLKKNSFGDAAAASLDNRVNQIPTGGPKAPAPDGRSDTELSRNVNNALNAMGGMGVVSSVPLRQPPASTALATVAPAAGFTPGAIAKTGELATAAAPQAAQAARGLPGTIAGLQEGAQANAYAAAARTAGGASAGATALDNNRPADPMVQPKVNSFGDASAVARGSSAALPSAGALGMGTAPQAAPQASPQVTTPEARKAVGLFPYSSPDAGKNIYAGFGFGKGGEQQAAGAPDDSQRIDSLVSQIPGNGGAPAPAADGSQGGWRDTELGRNVSNTMMALPGVGGLGRIAATGGAISTGLNAASTGINAASRMAALDAGVTARGFAPAAASTPATTPDANPYANVTPEQGRAMAEINAKAQPPVAAAPSAKQQLGLPPVQQPGGYDPNQSRPDLGYGPIGDRTKLTNEQAAIMNPAGRVTMTRGANGNMEFSGNNVSGQVSYNDASGKALPGGGLRGKGFSNFDVAPAGADVVMGPGGYAFATSGSGVGQNRGGGRGGGAGSGSAGGGYTPDGIDVRGLRGPQADRYAAEVRQAQATNAAAGQHARTVQNRIDQERYLSKLQAAASSRFGSPMERLTAQKAYNAALAQDAGFRAGADAGSVARTQNEGSSARERMQQTGATERAQAQEAGINARFDQTQGLAQQKFGVEREAKGFTIRAAAQQEQLRNVLFDPNATQEQKEAARQTLQLFNDPSEQWKAIATSGGKDELGNTLPGGVMLYNPATGESRPAGGQQQSAAQPLPQDPSKRKAGDVYTAPNGTRVKWDGKGLVPAQ